MKVALVYRDALRHGGYPRDVRWLAGALAARGVSVTVVAQPGQEYDGLGEGVRILPFGRDASDRWDVAHHAFGLFIPGQFAVSSSLRARTLVVSPGAHAMPLHLRRRWWKKLPYLIGIRSRLRTRQWACHVFSTAELAWARRALGARVWFTAPLGIFPPDDGTRDRGGADVPQEPFVLFMGRNDVRHKGIDLLVSGFALARQEGLSARLVIAGQPWMGSVERIQWLIRGSGVTDRVTVLGQVSEDTKWMLLHRARVLAFLSRWDGPPRPVREALSVGTPVVVSWETNLGDLVRREGAGEVVALDPAQVAAALIAAQNDAALGAWREGARRLARRLSWSRVAEDYIQGYLQALEADTEAA